MDKGWFPISGAKAVEAPVAIYTATGKLPMTLVTVLTPFASASELPKVENLSGNAPTAHVRVRFANGQTDEIMVAPQTANLKIGAQQKTARALIVRQGPQAVGVVALDGSMGEKLAAVAAVAAPMSATGMAGKVLALSAQSEYPATFASDGKSDTFWVSGGTNAGDGPTVAKPQWIQIELDKPQRASGLRIVGREGYGPKAGEIQVSDDGKTLRKIAAFNAKDGEATMVNFAPTSGKFFRVLMTSAFDVGLQRGSRNVQVSEVSLLK